MIQRFSWLMCAEDALEYVDIVRIQIMLTNKEIGEDAMSTVPFLANQGHPKTDFSKGLTGVQE
jgi:hypothetical protein